MVTMKGPGSPRLLLRLLCLAAILAIAAANIADFDESWARRAVAAREAAMKAFNPDPQSVTSNINQQVHQAYDNFKNASRRMLRGHPYNGPCIATNPIDRCWRCDTNWEKNRKKLADCALGFGKGTIGGRDGRIYVVTDSTDTELVNPKPGTLRYGATRKEPLWIIFARDMVIRLSEELIVASHKTIDGRGANVHIAFGAQITVQMATQVIIHGIHVHHTTPGSGGTIRDTDDHFGKRAASDGDGISIFASSHIWIDHVSMYKCYDGLVDIVQGSTAITVSNNHLTRHDHVMLFGAQDGYENDTIMQVTVAFNHFGKGLIQRMPRCRYGYFHVLNNDYTHWEMYAIGGSHNPTIISQGNRYTAHPKMNAQHNATEITKRENTDPSEWKNWVWKSENDIMKNGAFFVTSGAPNAKSPHRLIHAKPGTHVGRLTRFAGAINCKVGQPC